MKCEFKEFSHNACPVLEKKELTISIPVSIKGFAEVGEVKTKCGCHETICGDDCKGCHDAEDKFVITQKINVEIPLTFGAKTKVGEAIVDFDDECACHDKKDDECECKEEKETIDFIEDKLENDDDNEEAEEELKEEEEATLWTGYNRHR